MLKTALFALSMALAFPGAAAPAMAETQAPNVVLIVIDDAPMGIQSTMPNTNELIADQGVTVNGMIPTSLCCPSRSSLLTGNNSHTTGVYTNDVTNYGGWPAFHDGGAESSTLATHLNDAGYNTGPFGKYLNAYPTYAAGWVPPGWDHFMSMIPDPGQSGMYYDYTLEGSEPSEYHGEQPADYSTDVIATRAIQFIQDTPANQPLFLYFAPFGVHAPFTPAPRDIGTVPLIPASAIPALNENNVSDKPAWVQAQPKVSVLRQRQKLTAQHEVSMSVDDAVGQVITPSETGHLKP